MNQAKRQKLIFEMIKVKGEVKTRELAEKLNVSVMTIHRDLKELAKNGHIELIYGGAVYKEQPITEAPIHEKKLIGQYCNQLIPPGSSIFIETGTTTLAVAKEIFNKKNCTFFTNSLFVMNALSKYDDIHLHAVPGKYRELSKGFIGIQTGEYLQNFHFDYCIIGTEGICAETGVTVPDQEDAFTKRAVIKRGICRILVADSSKFGKKFLYKVGDLSAFDYIITDYKIDRQIFERIKQITRIIAVSEENVQEEL